MVCIHDSILSFYFNQSCEMNMKLNSSYLTLVIKSSQSTHLLVYNETIHALVVHHNKRNKSTIKSFKYVLYISEPNKYRTFLKLSIVDLFHIFLIYAKEKKLQNY